MNKSIAISLVFIFFLIFIFFYENTNKDVNNSKKEMVAFISLTTVDDNTFSGFKNKMTEYGWIENKNIEYFSLGAAKKISNLKSIVKSVIEKNPDLILVSSTPATKEVKKQLKNKEIPVIFCPVNDPVGSGILSNPSMPEGLLTGIRLPKSDYKRFEWLHYIVPNVKSVLIPFSPKDGSSIATLNNIKDIAKELNIKIIKKNFTDKTKIEDFLLDIPKSIDAIFLPRDSRVENKIVDFVKLSLERKLPLSAPSYQQVQKGALFTYGFIHTELGAQAARMADKVLKGVKPADIPVKIGNTYLVLNEDTAKAIGIDFPQKAINNAKLIIKKY